MGDHDYSWLTADEMLSWFKQCPTVVKTGIISREDYEGWDKVSPPESWCGGVSGPQVVVIQEAEVGKIDSYFSHVQVTWESDLKDELAYFFDEVKRLQEIHKEVRFVFGFDS